MERALPLKCLARGILAQGLAQENQFLEASSLARGLAQDAQLSLKMPCAEVPR